MLELNSKIESFLPSQRIHSTEEGPHRTHRAYRALLGVAKLEALADETVRIHAHPAVYATPFRVGEAATAALAAQGRVVAEIWRMRTGISQEVSVDTTDAAISLQSAHLLRQNGYQLGMPDAAYPTVGFYPTVDGRWVFLHGGYPLLRDGLLQLLGCANDRDAIAAAVKTWRATELENAILEKGLTGGMLRTPAEWRAHPQALALSELPVVEITRIADGPAIPLPSAERPLQGIRVLDATHVLAGPTCGRSLAEQGAEVLRITSPTRPDFLPFSIDTGFGKLSAHLDLDREVDFMRMRALMGGADIFVQSYRPGSMARRGFSPEAHLRPGLITVSVSCFGSTGPWSRFPGWEQVAQTVTGMAHLEGDDEVPALCPVYPNDYITGYLGAFGAMAALLRRATEGGSYHVSVSLSQTAMWLQSFGTNRAFKTLAGPGAAAIEKVSMESLSPFGRLRHLRPVLRYSETPGRWARPTVPLGTHEAQWPYEAQATEVSETPH